MSNIYNILATELSNNTILIFASSTIILQIVNCRVIYTYVYAANIDYHARETYSSPPSYSCDLSDLRPGLRCFRRLELPTRFARLWRPSPSSRSGIHDLRSLHFVHEFAAMERGRRPTRASLQLGHHRSTKGHDVVAS